MAVLHQRMFPQKLHIIFNTLLQLWERQEIETLDLALRMIRVALVQDGVQVGGREGEHAAVGVVDHRDFVGAEKLLGDYD